MESIELIHPNDRCFYSNGHITASKVMKIFSIFSDQSKIHGALGSYMNGMATLFLGFV